MPVKSKESAIVVDRSVSARKPKAGAAQHVPGPARQMDRQQETRILLEQIKVRGDQLSAEIKELLMRMS